MTLEDQRMAIAEFEGLLKRKPGETLQFQRWDPPNAVFQRVAFPDGSVRPCRIVDIPDYLHDLNAMHETESHLIQSTRLWAEYVMQLKHEMVGRYPLNDLRSTDPTIAIHATAAQRAEALLRTIGKWIEP